MIASELETKWKTFYVCDSVDHNVTSSAYGYDKWNCTSQSNFLSIMDFNLDNIYRLRIMPWLRKALLLQLRFFPLPFTLFFKYIFSNDARGRKQSELIAFRRPQYFCASVNGLKKEKKSISSVLSIDLCGMEAQFYWLACGDEQRIYSNWIINKLVWIYVHPFNPSTQKYYFQPERSVSHYCIISRNSSELCKCTLFNFIFNLI